MTAKCHNGAGSTGRIAVDWRKIWQKATMTDKDSILSSSPFANRRHRPGRRSSAMCTPMRRCRSAQQVNNISTVNRDSSVDARPGIRQEPPPKAMFESVDFDLTSAMATAASSLSTTQLSASAASLKAKLKCALNRASSSLKSGNAQHPPPSSEPATRVCNSNLHESNAKDVKSTGSEEMLQKELENGLRYFQEVVRTQKMEILIGSVSAIIDTVIKLTQSFEPQVRVDDVHSALVDLLNWTDARIVDCVLPDLTISIISRDDASRYANALSAAVTRLLLLDNGAPSAVLSDNGATSAVPTRPPRHKRPVSTSSNERKLSPPVSITDSGIFADENGNGVDEEKISHRNVSSIVIDETNLDDLLAQLNLTSRRVEKFVPDFAKITVDESDDDEEVDSGVMVDEEREERHEKHGSQTCEEEVEETDDGRQIRRTKIRTVAIKQSSKHVTIRTTGGIDDKSFVRRFTDADQSFQDDADFQIDERFGGDFFANRRPYSPYDNDNDDVDAIEWHDADDGQMMKKKTRSVKQESATLQSVTRQAKKNGRLVADDAAHKLDTAALNASQTDTFKGDQLIDRHGGGTFDEQCVIRMGRCVRESTDSTTTDAPLDSPPPIPPKRRHVVQYMQIIGKVPGDDENDNQRRQSHSIDYFKGSTMASYIMLNDNLRYHEEQYRKRFQFEFGGRGASTSTTYSSPTAGSSPAHDLNNLSRLLQLSDFDRIRLPTQFTSNEDDDNDGQQKAIGYVQRLALSAPPTILHVVDATDYLVLRCNTDSATPEVRGGPRDALIVFATQPNGSLLYQEAFLATYRTFVTATDLAQKLITRYRHFAGAVDQCQRRVARQTFSLLVRVVDELCTVEVTRELIGVVTSFVYSLIGSGSLTFARLLRKRLMDRVEEKAGFKLTIGQEIPQKSGAIKPSTIFAYRSAALAQQLTYLDAELFLKIEPAEMLWWAQEQKEEKSPNLAAFTEHFNKMSYWVRTIVIQQAEQRDREKYVQKFIKIMKQLRRVGNFNSYLAILSALDSGPIRRLDWSKNVLDQLKEHSAIMDSSHSFKNYRTLLSETRPPCLPYIGLILQDLTFVHVGNPDCIAAKQCQDRKDLLNFGKRWQQYAILDSVRRFKTWSFPITKDDRILRIFAGFNHYLSEDETWELSESIKPRSRRIR